MFTFDCFTDRRPRPAAPTLTTRQEAAIVAQRPLLGPAEDYGHRSADIAAAREWLAHVDAGRIGEGVR